MAVRVQHEGGVASARRSTLHWLAVALLMLASTSLVLIYKATVELEPMSLYSLRRQTTEQQLFSPREQELLRMGDVLSSRGVLYPDAMDQVDWSALIPRSDVLHHGALQRACVSLGDNFISPDFGQPDASAQAVNRSEASQDGGRAFIEVLRQCAPVDLYIPIGIRGQGYCEDAAAYAKYLKARMLPRWVMELTYFDAALNRNFTYHELCPKTPMVFFNHYWDGLRDERDWPMAKPLYLMPNIEMYELEGKHYREADVILCKTAICAQYLTKWFDQEGNMRGTRVLFTRFTTSDVATNALVAAGEEAAEQQSNPMRQKSFSDLQFIHTAGTSMQKGTKFVLDCWLKRSDLPPLNVYVAEDTYDAWFRGKYDKRIRKSASVHLHLGKMDASAFGLLLAQSAFFLCTSLMEGYGHYINHARASGALIVTTDVPPMNELVTPASGVLIRAKRTAREKHFLGGISQRADALKDVEGFVAAFRGPDVCEAVDTIVKELSETDIRRRAERARQQYYYDTAFFAMKMDELREAVELSAIG